MSSVVETEVESTFWLGFMGIGFKGIGLMGVGFMGIGFMDMGFMGVGFIKGGPCGGCGGGGWLRQTPGRHVWSSFEKTVPVAHSKKTVL